MLCVLVLFVVAQTFAMFMAWQANHVFYASLAQQSGGVTPVEPIQITPEPEPLEPAESSLPVELPVVVEPDMEEPVELPDEPRIVGLPEGTPSSSNLVDDELRLARIEIDEAEYSMARRRLYRLDANRDKYSLSETARAEIEYLIAESYARAAQLISSTTDEEVEQ